MDPRQLPFGHHPQMQNVPFQQPPGNFLQGSAAGFGTGIPGSAQSSLIMNSWLHQAHQVSALAGHSAAASFPYPAAASQQMAGSLAGRFFQSAPASVMPSIDPSLRGYMTQTLLAGQNFPHPQQQQLLRQNVPTPGAISTHPNLDAGNRRKSQAGFHSDLSCDISGRPASQMSGSSHGHSPCTRQAPMLPSGQVNSPSSQVIPHSPMVHHMPAQSPPKSSPMLAAGRSISKAPLSQMEQMVATGMPTLSQHSLPEFSEPTVSHEATGQQRSAGTNVVSHGQPSGTVGNSGGLFSHSVDALEEALVTLSRDYNLESDLTDLNEHLLRDAFFGPSASSAPQETELTKISSDSQMPASSEGSLLHSILEYDPSALTQTSGPSEDHLLDTSDLTVEKQRTPPAVEVPPSHGAVGAMSSHQPDTYVVAPKLREKIKMKREKELAEIDKAFDRHLSLVAERNERSSSTAAPPPQINLPPVTPAVPYPSSVAHSMSPANSAAEFSGTPCPSTADRSESVAPLSPVRFSPVQFSPDASDKEESQFGFKPSFGDHDCEELKVFIPLPDKKSKGNGPKIPIYKQAAGGSGSLKPKLEIGAESAPVMKKLETSGKTESGDSPYEFTDEEEELEKTRHKSGGFVSSVDLKKEQRLEEEVARKLMQISSLHPELKIPGMTGQQGSSGTGKNQQGLTRAQQAAVVAAVSRAGFDGRKFQSPQSVAAVQQVINQVAAGVQEPSTDLWRHVVPKKRHSTKDRNSEGQATQPSAPLLPPVSVENNPTPRSQPEVVVESKPTAVSLAAQLAETLKKRKEKLKEHCFVRTEIIIDDDSTAMPSPKTAESNLSAAAGGQFLPKQEILPRSEDPIEPLLPKVIIRIPKKCITIKEEPMEQDEETKVHRKHKKKHRKHKHREEQHKHREGETANNEEGKKRKKKKKKHKHRKGEFTDDDDIRRKSERRRTRKIPGPEFTSPSSSDNGENSESEDPLWKPSRTAEPKLTEKSSGHFSKKKRLISSFSETPTEDSEVGKGRSHTKSSSFDLEVDDEAANDQRLAQFRQPTGMLQKGTFVVLKEDIGKSDCPLWRVDNQNLLQKFPPKENNNGISYHSSSTYSGWCPQNSEQYLVVQVRYLQHTRSESIVEPEIPILDLFPAVSTEVSGNRVAGPELLCGGALSPPECDQHAPAPVALPDQPIRDALDAYLHALVMHCLSGNFLQNLRANNEWKFLRQIHDIDSLNGNKKAKLIAQVKWDSKFRNLVEWYPLCTIGDTEGAGLTCQACHSRNIEKVVQLFANEAYDFDTLESKPPRRAPSGSPQPSQEYLVCLKCTEITEMYHKLYHMRYHLFRSCEDKIELIRDENPNVEPAVVQEQCLRNRSWVNHITSPYLELWNRIS